jgi:hypothetical protein
MVNWPTCGHISNWRLRCDPPCVPSSERTDVAACDTNHGVDMADEVKDAKRKVPQAMVWATSLSAVVMFVFIIVLLFCLGDVGTPVRSRF